MWIFDRFRGDEVERQIKRLRSKRSTRDDVVEAMGELRDMGGRAVLPLIQVLLNRDEGHVFRCRVADTLAWLKDGRAVEPLITTLSDSNEQVRWHGVKALEEIGDRRAIPELRRIAESDEGQFSIPGGRVHFVLKEDARKAIEKIEASTKH
ncbi:MAG TPA: HEAT repeat domain-containing protein [Pyrinomonadaceae bacterium]|nr:HEAT repeat domain-containing protein [Pyrinomonadaceae bacterium]